MSTRTLFAAFAVICCVVARNRSAAAEPPAKYALLVAVTRYNHAEMNKPQLKFPEADAKGLGATLEQSGYKVDYLLGDEAKREAIFGKLRQLPEQGNADGVVLIGLFGHGVAIVDKVFGAKQSTTGFYCPFDSKVRTAQQADGRTVPGLIEPDPSSLVSLVDVLGSLGTAGAPSRVLLADCCRKIANRARGRSLDFGSGFSTNDLPDGTAVLFGCAPNEQAFEHDDWGHGAFTKCLLEELEDLSQSGRATTGTLIDRLKQKVPALVKTKAAPGETQTPKPFFLDSVDLRLDAAKPTPGANLLARMPECRRLIDKAKAIAERITEDNQVSAIYRDLGIFAAEAGDLVVAHDFARACDLHDGLRGDTILGCIAKFHFRSGQHREGLASLKENTYRAAAMKSTLR